MSKPKFEHDCDECIFLGTEEIVNVGTVDMYVHEREHYTELIARFSSDGPDYYCIPSMAIDGKIKNNPALRICQLLWEVRKLENLHKEDLLRRMPIPQTVEQLKEDVRRILWSKGIEYKSVTFDHGEQILKVEAKGNPIEIRKLISNIVPITIGIHIESLS